MSSTKSSRYARAKIYDKDDANSGPIPVLFLKEMLKNAKKNAKSRGLEFLIDGVGVFGLQASIELNPSEDMLLKT